MKIAKNLALIGCALALGLALIKWSMPRLEEIEMAFSEPLPDGDYIVGHSSNPDRIKIKHGKIYHVT